MIVLSALLQADNIFSSLPYDIKMGEKLPNKIINMDLEESKNKNYLVLDLAYKFKILTSHTYKVKRLVFAFQGKYTANSHKLPKKWRKSGLLICRASYKGTSYADVLKIVKNNNVTDIETHVRQTKILFKVDNDKQYTFYFNNVPDVDKGFCKGGLSNIGIAEIIEEEY